MGREVISVRQMMILLLVALLGPAVDLLPGVAANRGGWISALAALPLLLAAVWANSNVFCRQGVWERIGKPIGSTIVIMYMIWSLVVLAAVLRLSAARMGTVYSGAPSWLFGVAVAVLGVWMGKGKVSVLARSAEVFYLGLTVLFAGILLLAVFQLEWKNLYQVEWSAVPGGGIAIAGMCMSVAPAAVLGSNIPKGARGLRKAFGWTVAFDVFLALLSAAVIGTLGNGLSSRLETPFLIMVQGLGIKGAFQRNEALVAAMCLLSDVIFAGALLRAWVTLAGRMKPGSWGRRSVPVAAAIALFGGWLLFPEGNNVRMVWNRVLSGGGLAFGLVFPIFLLMISSGNREKRR